MADESYEDDVTPPTGTGTGTGTGTEPNSTSHRTFQGADRDNGDRTATDPWCNKAGPIKIIYRSVASVKPAPGNPRRHSAKQTRQLAASIKVFGFNAPVLVDADLNVIAGHGRLLAAKELGLSEIRTPSAAAALFRLGGRRCCAVRSSL